MAIRKRSMLAVALVAGFACAIPACSSNDDKGGKTAESNTGSLGLNLIVGGLQLNAVTLTISNTTLLSAPIVRTINVSSNQATASAFVGGLPVGAGYAVTLSATATDGTECGGAAVPFTVLANQTVSVSVPITCGTTTAAPTRGNVNINGQISVAPQCAYLTNVVVAPLQVGVGETIDVSALASMASGVGYQWSATNGTFAAATSASTTYTCTVAGSQDVTIALTTTGATGCTADTITATVNCFGPICGNGVVEPGEQCDPPATGTCSNTCQIISGSGGSGGSGGSTGGAPPTGGTAGSGGTTGGAPPTGGTAGTGGDTGGAPPTGGTAGTGGDTGGAPPTGGTAGSGGTTGGAPPTGGTGGTTGGAPPTGGTAGTGGIVNACTTCQTNNCPGPLAARTNLCATSNTAGTQYRPLCDAYEACLATTNCANTVLDPDGFPEPRYCYCGTVDNDTCFSATATPTTPQGPCRDVFATLAGASLATPTTTPAPSVVGATFFDISVPFGAEGQVLLCTQSFCEPNGYCAP